MKAAQIIREAAASVAHLDDARDRLAQQVGYLQAAIRSLYCRYTGEGAKPQSGCAFYLATVGDTQILFEYEYQPGEEPVYDLDSPMCGPGCGESVSLMKALVNGKWCDPPEVVPESVIERVAGQIAEHENEVASEQKEGVERDRYDDARDFADMRVVA
jgi:hypothetical protein